MIKCTAVSGLDEVKCLKASATCDLVLVVLKSLEDVPSPFLMPSSRKPSVAVDDIVSRQTMYLKKYKYILSGLYRDTHLMDCCQRTSIVSNFK